MNPGNEHAKNWIRYPSLRWSAVLTGIAAVLLAVCNIASRTTLAADSPPAEAAAEGRQVTIYDADPAHLWNRLHSALFVRTWNGESYGHDEVVPLIWPGSQYLVERKHHDHIVALLDEFLATDGDRLAKVPLQRAVFQHDLWAIFDWLANPRAVYNVPADGVTPEQRALQIRLARIIRKLALSVEQIELLPDNYAAAIASKAFPTSHNPDQPQAAFLPLDLFDPDGPWVVLGDEMQPAAPVHNRSARGSSAFFVFLNLPAGRQATIEYLKELEAFPNPLLPDPSDPVSPPRKRLNPQLPQFPVGTQVALAREMLLIDDRGEIRATRLIESLQIRIYREIPGIDPEHLLSIENLPGKQDFYEFQFTRKELFSGNSGGLQAVAADAKGFVLLQPHPWDPFEHTYASPPKPRLIIESCSGCHGKRRTTGIHSVLAYRRGFTPGPLGPAKLKESERAQQEQAAMQWKRSDERWEQLQELMKPE